MKNAGAGVVGVGGMGGVGLVLICTKKKNLI